MNFVIPMAGRGQRFRDAGYELPKMLIEAKGKTLLEWSVDSLPLDLCTNLIFIGLEEHEQAFNISAIIRQKYEHLAANLQLIFLKEVTRGQSETVLMAEHLLDKSLPIAIFNIDTYFASSSLAKLLQADEYDGVLGTFFDHEATGRFSYAALNEQKEVSLVKEKEAISPYALTGFYHFKSSTDFCEIAKGAIQNNETQKGEFYIAPLYNKLIERKQKFVLDLCDTYHILGTPAELKEFINDEQFS